ncbi:hypothetical protein BH24ACT5_BH24ACT5_04510 [soil metagenome]
MVGATVPAAVVGGINGALAGHRRVHRWRSIRGVTAFVLDSTWALPSTAVALVAHAVAALQREPGNYLVELSEGCDRHVYARGLTVRRGFLLTTGNVVNGAGRHALRVARQRRVVTVHEHAHVWQARWLGPLYPVAYLGWSALGAVAGTVRWMAGSREQPFGRSIEAWAYYANPFEWWAYSREERWPPPGALAPHTWRRPFPGHRLRIPTVGTESIEIG